MGHSVVEDEHGESQDMEMVNLRMAREGDGGLQYGRSTVWWIRVWQEKIKRWKTYS